MSAWKTNLLPNGEWEVIEYVDGGRSYSTVVRGITKEQCEKIVQRHGAACKFPKEAYEWNDDVTKAGVDKVHEGAKPFTDGVEWEAIR